MRSLRRRRRFPMFSAWRGLAAPLRAGLTRTLAEGAVILVALYGLAFLLSPGGPNTSQAETPMVVALVVLACWSAWRLRRARGERWWSRLFRGFGRLLLYAFLIDVVAYAESLLLWPIMRHVMRTQAVLVAGSFGQAFVLLLFFLLWARVAVRVAAALRRRSRRRLRWQLTASHLTAVLLPLVIVSVLGSVAGSLAATRLILAMLQPDAPGFASSVAHALTPIGGSGFDRRRAAVILQEIENGRVQPQSNPFFNAIDTWGRQPNYVLLMDLNGRLVSAGKRVGAQGVGRPPSIVASGQRLVPAARDRAPSTLPPLSPADWRTLRRAALTNRTAVVSAPTTLWPLTKGERDALSVGGVRVAGDRLAAAPVVVAGRPVAVVVVRVPRLAAPPLAFFSGVFVVLSIPILFLILVALLPIFGLASLFGYLMARGMTRRLEAVSRVATAIAAGDLSQRAPMTSEDEVGGLAGDVNRMAAHLETAIGALRQARTQAEDALQSRQQLVANISHELRTPLAIVRAHLDTLALRRPSTVGAGAREGRGALAAREEIDENEIAVPATTLRALRSETERLEHLVDDLFALSRVQTGQLGMRRVPVDVAALVDDVAALMRPLAQREGMIALLVEAPPGPPALADPDRLRQILENLVRNAVRHTPDGGIIVLSVAVEEGQVVLSVADTGEGIPPEHLPHIFERFYRADASRARSSGGAGLGLAIVREFVELMGGHVTVASAPGEGSHFRVFLPLAPHGDDASASGDGVSALTEGVDDET